MGKFKEQDIERLDAVESLHATLTPGTKALKPTRMIKHEVLKKRIQRDVERIFSETNRPIRYRQLFRNLYSTLKGEMTPRELAEQMHDEDFIRIERSEIGFNAPTWVFPGPSFLDLNPLELADLAAQATHEALEAKRIKMSVKQKEIWHKRKEEE